MTEPDKKPASDSDRNRQGYGLVTGLAIGVALGVALDNLAIGLAIGVAIGVALSSAARNRPEDPDKSSQN